MRQSIHQAYRTLLLPTVESHEASAISSLLETAVEGGVPENDVPLWLLTELEQWGESGHPGPLFVAVLKNAISSGDDRYGILISEAYFETHTKLRSEWGFGHDEARWFLSHATLLATLANRYAMTGAQVAKVMCQRDSRVRFSRSTVTVFLAKIGMEPKLELDVSTEIFEEDRAREVETFADADLEAGAAIVAVQAITLGFPQNLEALLLQLAGSAELDRYTPYVQMLHYQATIAEVFDHDLMDLYEFNPRGKAFTELMSMYPERLVSAKNPFLNNAKSVERATIAWARSKKQGERFGAFALQEILSGLSEMGFPARRELCGLIRQWVHRLIRLSEPLTVRVPNQLSHEQINLVIKRVAEVETNTAGVIEQRLVDALTSTLHPRNAGWHSRGLGDSVNATNVSRRKLGDCDFQIPQKNIAVAYEAHGGVLTDQYLASHIATLPKLIRHRVEEWESFSDPSDWAVTIWFVAHDLQAESPESFVIDNIQIDIQLMTYYELRDRVQECDLSQAALEYVLTPLSEPNTPNRVREKLNELAST